MSTYIVYLKTHSTSLKQQLFSYKPLLCQSGNNLTGVTTVAADTSMPFSAWTTVNYVLYLWHFLIKSCSILLSPEWMCWHCLSRRQGIVIIPGWVVSLLIFVNSFIVTILFTWFNDAGHSSDDIKVDKLSCVFQNLLTILQLSPFMTFSLNIHLVTTYFKFNWCVPF